MAAKAQYSDEKVLRQLSPKTQQDLLSVLAPLMQWLDVRGQSDAIRFDMDILAAQTARYTNPEELDVLWPVIVEKSGAPAAAFGTGAATGTTNQSAS